MKQFENLTQLNKYINQHPINIESVDVQNFTVTYRDSNARTMSRMVEAEYPAYILFDDELSYEEFKRLNETNITFEFHTINAISASVTLSQFYELRESYNIELIELYDTHSKSEELNITVDGVEYSDNYNWAMDFSGLVKAWDDGFMGEGVSVAVIDKSFEDLNDISVPCQHILIEGRDIYFSNHGSTCISVVGARLNNKVSVGTAPKCNLYALETGIWNTEVLKAYQWCIDNNIDIVSISLGNTHLGDTADRLLNALHDNGIILVAAAGNDNDSPNMYPAFHEKVISVGGVARDGTSLRAPSFNVVNKPWIDFIYSAQHVASTTKINGVETNESKSGTSVSAPAIAGHIACLKQEFPNWSKDELIEHMKGYSFKFDNYYGVFPIHYKHLRGIETKVAKITSDADLLIKGELSVHEANKIKFTANGDLYVSDVLENQSKVVFNYNGKISVRNIIENSEI